MLAALMWRSNDTTVVPAPANHTNVSAGHQTHKSPAIIVVHPAGGVKEQTASLYAQQLSEHGFVTVAYDASHQGDSGGLPRLLEDPSERISDISSVVDWLEQQDFVDPERIAVVGICAGGGYGVAATKADHRIKALATVSGVNNGDIAREGWLGTDDPTLAADALDNVTAQLTSEAAGGEPAYAFYVPDPPTNSTPYDLVEAFDYYRTPRAQHPNSQNRMLLRSLLLILTFDAYRLADLLLTQPVLLIVGGNSGALWSTSRLNQILGGATKQVIVPNGTHMDFYDKAEYVNTAVAEIVEFFSIHV